MFKNEEEFKEFVDDLPWDDAPDPAHRELLLADLLHASDRQNEPATNPPPSSSNTGIGRIVGTAVAAALVLGGVLAWWPRSGEHPHTKDESSASVHKSRAADVQLSAVDGYVARATGILRGRLLEISESDAGRDGSVLWNTTWEVKKILYEASEDAFRELRARGEGAALREHRLDVEAGEREPVPQKRFRQKAAEPFLMQIPVLGLEAIKSRHERGAREFAEQASIRDVVGAETMLFVRRMGSDLVGEIVRPRGDPTLDEYESRIIDAVERVKGVAGGIRPEAEREGLHGKDDQPEPGAAEARRRLLSGRWIGMAVDKPGDGTSRDSLTLELDVSRAGELKGTASGEFVGDRVRNLHNPWLRRNRLGFILEHRTGSRMEVSLELVGYRLVGEGTPLEPDGDRCDIALHPVAPLRNENEGD